MCCRDLLNLFGLQTCNDTDEDGTKQLLKENLYVRKQRLGTEWRNCTARRGGFTSNLSPSRLWKPQRQTRPKDSKSAIIGPQGQPTNKRNKVTHAWERLEGET